MYIILDCNGNVVGNQCGYHTFKAADGQVKRDKSPTTKALNKAYYEKYGPYEHGVSVPLTGRQYCTIKSI